MRPPEPYTARPATPADAGDVAALVTAYECALVEDPDEMGAADVTGWWVRLELERDTVLVHDPGGPLVAAGSLEERQTGRLDLDAYVHPNRLGRGLGGFLLDWLEREADRRDCPVRRSATLAVDRPARDLLTARGYEPIRHFYRMLIDLDALPPDPVWPEGFRVSTFRPGEEAILRTVTDEAFADHWGFEPRTAEYWQKTVFGQEWWDPSLVYLVREGDEVVAAEINAVRFGMGFVNTIGTRRPWRGRGLARALLLQAFGELYRRGEPRVGLAVDAGNETGATRLYESVGMRIASQDDVYEKRR